MVRYRAPVITVTSGADTVEQGDTWVDSGATADGSEPVSTSGTVNTSTVGTYTITYTATDATGNIGTATRTVTVVPVGSVEVEFNITEVYGNVGGSTALQISEIRFYDDNDNQVVVTNVIKPDGSEIQITNEGEEIDKCFDGSFATKWYHDGPISTDSSPDQGKIKFILQGQATKYAFWTAGDNNAYGRLLEKWTTTMGTTMGVIEAFQDNESEGYVPNFTRYPSPPTLDQSFYNLLASGEDD